MRLWAIVAGFLICFAFTGMAQTSQQPFVDVYHSSWTTKDGAPRGVTSLAQTRDGYLWIGTIFGLYRFDGTHFSNYTDADDVPNLPGTIIMALTADDGNGVWAGYDRGGISHIARDHVANIKLPINLRDNGVYGIYCCAQHSVWVIAGDTILRWKNGAWEDLASQQGLPRSSYWGLFFDRSGNIWASSPTGIYEWRSGEEHFSLFSKKITNAKQFAQARDGAIWIADGAGNIRSLISTCSQSSSSLRVTSSILFDAVGKLWIGSDEHGVIRTTPSSIRCHDLKQSESFTTVNGLTSNTTRALLVDNFGDIWVGTSTGIDRFRPRHFTPFGVQYFNQPPGLAAATDGSVWIQKPNHKLIHVSDKSAHEIGPLRETSPLTSDSGSGVWLFDRWGQYLLHYNSAEHLDRKVPAPPTLFHPTAKSIVSKADGSVLITFEGNGLWSYSEHWRLIDLFPNMTPTTINQDGETTWAGYKDNFIVSLNRDNRQKYDSSNGLDIDTPLVITCHDAVLWAGGTRGVDFMVRGRFYKLRVRAPERLRGVSGLVFDNSGDLWLNTGFGAMQIKSKEVSKAIQNPQYAAITEVYGTADGVIGFPAQRWPTPSLIQDGYGRLWFGTFGNLVNMHPSVLAAPRSKPFVDLQFIRINGKRIVASDLNGPTILLEGGRMNRIEFHFTAVDLDHPNHIIFRY